MVRQIKRAIISPDREFYDLMTHFLWVSLDVICYSGSCGSLFLTQLFFKDLFSGGKAIPELFRAIYPMPENGKTIFIT